MAALRSPSHPLALRRRPGPSAVVADRPPFPIYVLSGTVDTDCITDEPAGTGWWEIPCASRRAHGCAENIREALQGLRLYARLGDGHLLASSLAIRMTPEALARLEREAVLRPRRFDSDHDEFHLALPSQTIRAAAEVKMAEEQGLTVILLSLLWHPLCYLLVYDVFDQSLSMFPIPLDVCRDVCTLKPIVPERIGSGGDYTLLLLVHEHGSSPHKEEDGSSPHKEEDVFWVCSLAWDGSLSKLKRMDFPAATTSSSFMADVAFSFHGKQGKDFWSVWGDLDQGLVYCNLYDDDMDFGFVKLPAECESDEEWDDGPHKLVRRTRTLGCVGDSIRLVCAGGSTHYTNDVVSIWEMELPGGKGKGKEVQWKKVEEVPAKVLWEQPSFKEAGLPAAPFEYPILTPEGALSFVLVDYTKFPWHQQNPMVEHICSFDMHCKLQWHGLVHNYTPDSVIMRPSARFLYLKPCSHKRSFVEDSVGDTE